MRNNNNPYFLIGNQYREKKLEKYDYIDKMHKNNKVLYYLSSWMKHTDVQKIEILDDLLIFTTRKRSIKMAFRGVDRRGVPFDLLNFGEYEKEDEVVLNYLIESNKVILDVGANVGWYSILFSRMNPEASIYAFEPIQETYDYLVTNLTLNACSNVSHYQVGLKDKSGTASYFYFPEGSVLASEENVIECEKAKNVTCPVKKMDEFTDEHKILDKVGFIKCDVEGAEKLVLDGGLETIERSLPALFIELFERWTLKFNYHPNEVIELLSRYGYKCYIFMSEKLVELVEYKEFEDERLNFFFLHSDKHKNVINKFR